MSLTYKIQCETQEGFNSVIEISRNTTHKYEYDERLDVFKLNRILLPSMVYPGNYGFIPQTLGDDEDPLDVLIIKSGVIERGTLVEFYPIGALNMLDDGKEDLKIIGIPVFHHLKNKITSIMDLDVYFVDQIHHFFKCYKDLENKSVEIKGWITPEETIEKIKKANSDFFVNIVNSVNALMDEADKNPFKNIPSNIHLN